MNSAKCDDHAYINFMIAAQRAFSCTEAARCQPTEDKAASHDAFTRLLTRQPPPSDNICKARSISSTQLRKSYLSDSSPGCAVSALSLPYWRTGEADMIWGIIIQRYERPR